jgi:hypothetical protein
VIPLEAKGLWGQNEGQAILGLPPRMLSELKIKAAKPTDKPYKLFDGGGLYLEVKPNGSKLWRYKFRFQGKENRLSLGRYPEVSLKQARQKHAELRAKRLNGENPAASRRREMGSLLSFGRVAAEWLAVNKEGWALTHYATIVQRLDNHILPAIGERPIQGLMTADILPIARRLEAAGKNETAHRTLNIISQVMRFAVVTGRAERDPCSDLRGALAPIKKNHFAAITDPLGRAYNRTTHLDARRLMMQAWADYLDSLKYNKPEPSCSARPGGSSCSRGARAA